MLVNFYTGQIFSHFDSGVINYKRRPFIRLIIDPESTSLTSGATVQSYKPFNIGNYVSRIVVTRKLPLE